MDNMSLWNQVCETDPGWTKPVVIGSRKFTAIDAQHQIKRATELWGPYGFRWGVRNLEWGYIWGKDGEPPIAIVLDAEFFYPVTWEMEGAEPKDVVEQSITAFFTISADMPWKAGGETRKKLLTDLTTKALSKLGFNSDVFEGKFDDNRYVEEMAAKASGRTSFDAEQKEPTPTSPGSKPAAAPPDKNTQRFLEAISSLMDDERWDGQIFYTTLGSMGYEDPAEIKSETERRKFVATLRREMGIPK